MNKALECEFDQGFAGNNALGLIVLKTDETLEIELRSVFERARVACYQARIPSHALVTPETLAEMEQDLPATAALLPPGVEYGAIGYACTSGATIIGTDKVAQAVERYHPNAPVTDPISAVMAGLRTLHARKVGLLTPYVPAVTGEMQKLLEREGFQIGNVAAFGQSEDRMIARITEQSTFDAILGFADCDCDAVFVSCTNLRSFNILDTAEQRLGKPVISSNQALGWHMMQLAGLETAKMGPGRLFSIRAG